MGWTGWVVDSLPLYVPLLTMGNSWYGPGALNVRSSRLLNLCGYLLLPTCLRSS